MSGSEKLSSDLLRGPISWMARNRVTANLFMFMIFVAGFVGLASVHQEVFPQFELDMVAVNVAYPGASPEEVEQGIVLAVEEAVRGLDGVKRVTGVANEGVGTVTVEMLISADPESVLADVKNQVDRITTFPAEAEQPQVSLLDNKNQVITLVIHGDADLATLHQLAERSRVELLNHPDITQVELTGVPPLEVSVEVSRETLRAYGLTLGDVARAITASSLELPGGSVKTEAGEILVRVSDRKRTGAELAEVIVLGTPGGGLVRLGDLATIRDGFAELDQEAFYDGEPAVRLTVFRVGEETPQKVAAAVRAHVDELRQRLPDHISASVWDDDSQLLQGRIQLLVGNARMGLILVVLILALFLNLRLAFWVALGIPTSFLGAFAIMPAADVSVNMISLFALIVTLGMVVDDAIVVGENAFEKMQQGVGRLEASIAGAREMAVPVTFAILTSVAAFAPMFFVPGAFGKIFRIFPLIVIAVLVFSLLESFFILPAHLAHGSTASPGRISAAIGRVQDRVASLLTRFTRELYEPTLELALDHRYVVIAMAMALFLGTIGLLGGGIVPFSFFPKVEGDVVTASVRLPYGVPLSESKRVMSALEASADAVIAELDAESALDGRLTLVGETPAGGGPHGAAAAVGSHLVSVQLQFLPADQRDFTATEFKERWTQLTPALAGVEALTFNADIGPAATTSAVDVQLSHRDTEILARAAAELTASLGTFPSLVEVQNGYASGKPQLDFELRPQARSLGLTTGEVARQLRSAFYGAEALREQRDRNEMKVMVRLPREQRLSEYDIEELEIRSPLGGYVPLSYVADFRRDRAPTTITREGGRRIVDVTAGLAPGVPSNQPILARLEAETLPALRARYPGLSSELVGQQREQNESLAALGRGYVMALFAIYALLAIPFKSYLQPAVVMSAIPFGFVGAVLGHLLMGYELSMISLFGIIALSGVVVNDSLVLIDATNSRRREGASARQAILWGGARRLRPILLTSLTTFFGLMPMLLETDVQARFLIPMAISLGFGVLFSTAVILVLVPALYMVLEDLHRLVARAQRRRVKPPEELPALSGG